MQKLVSIKNWQKYAIFLKKSQLVVNQQAMTIQVPHLRHSHFFNITCVYNKKCKKYELHPTTK